MFRTNPVIFRTNIVIFRTNALILRTTWDRNYYCNRKKLTETDNNGQKLTDMERNGQKQTETYSLVKFSQVTPILSKFF